MDDEANPVWQYIAMDQFSRPTGAATEAVRHGLWRFWRDMRRDSHAKKDATVRTELHLPASSVLEEAVPLPDWRQPLGALDLALGNWAEDNQEKPALKVLVTPPHCGTSAVLMHWATTHKWRLIEPPSPDQILQGGAEWLSILSHEDPHPLVIPRLERWYLRHFNGLTLIRKVLNWLSSSPYPCLVGCDSWAWAYLKRAIQIESILPAPLTLAALDGERLQLWLSSLHTISREKHLDFRFADSGDTVLAQSKKENTTLDTHQNHQEMRAAPAESKGSAEFFDHIATYSRGNPGVAWSVFRHTLRTSPDDSECEESGSTVDSDQGPALWVEPWSAIRFPTVPPERSPVDLFIFHTVLLHGTIPQGLLPQLLPFSSMEVVQALNRLRTAGLIDMESDSTAVNPLAYPVVRQFIGDEGYHVDAF